MKRLLVMWLLTACVASRLAGQVSTATLQGVITATGGAIIPGTEVEVRSRETGAGRSARVDVRGAYRVLGLPPGSYDVTARAVGYRAQRRSDVALAVGDQAILNLTLEPGAVELEPVVVQAGAALQLQRTDVATPVLEREIERLPLNTRDVLALASIAPGVRSFAPEAGRSVPAAGAVSSARFVNLYVDGLEWKGMATGSLVGVPQTGSLIPQDAIREYRVSLNPYDAEYTGGASWVISAVTHQGGNTLQGSAFGFEQSKALVAQGTFQQTKPDYGRQQFGGSLRGPLWRDRLFFAASYEAQVTDNFISVVPGRPTTNPGIWDRYAGTFRAPFQNRMGLARLTALRGRHSVDAIWTTRRLWSESNFGVQAGSVVLARDAGTVARYGVTTAQLRDRFVSRSLVNELSFHLLQFNQNDTPLVPGPTLRYPGIQVGRNTFPVTIAERHLGVSDKVSYAVRGLGGQHVLKAGVDLTNLWGRGYQPTNKDGLFIFPADTSTQPSRGTIGLGVDSLSDARATIEGWLIGGYVQDQWHPVAALVVTAGVRYDVEIGTLNQGETAPWASDTTLQRVVGTRYLNAGDRQTDRDNVAPRIAAAWDVRGDGRTSLRVGYGVLYDRVPVFGAFSEKIAWSWRTYTFANPRTTDPAVLRARVLANRPAAAPNIVLLPDRLETPSNHQWSVGIARRLSDHLTLNLDYLDQHMTNLPVTVTANLPNPATGQRPLTNRFGGIVLWGSFGDATFRGVLTSVMFDRGPTHVSAAYTRGWAKSEFGGVSTSDYPDSAAYSLQRSEGDERHRLVLSGLTELSFGLQVSAIVVVASPRPFAATIGTDVNQNGFLDDDWPNGVRTWRREGWDNWYRTVDVRLGKAFPLPRGRLLVTVDVFNLFNVANHSEYQAKQSLLLFRAPIGDYARRQAQVGVRYQF